MAQHEVSDIYLLENGKGKLLFPFSVVINISHRTEPASLSDKTNPVKNRKHLKLYYCVCYLQHELCHTWVYGWSGLLTGRLCVCVYFHGGWGSAIQVEKVNSNTQPSLIAAAVKVLLTTHVDLLTVNVTVEGYSSCEWQSAAHTHLVICRIKALIVWTFKWSLWNCQHSPLSLCLLSAAVSIWLLSKAAPAPPSCLNFTTECHSTWSHTRRTRV